MLGWARGKVPAGGERAFYLARLAKNLRALNDYAKEKGVRVNIEVINHYEMNIFTTAEETVSFLEEHALDNCFVHLDTYHMQLEETDYRAAIRRAGKRLGYFHIADSSRWYPGSGTLDFAPFFEALEEIGYDGVITVECFLHGDGEGTAKKAIEYLDDILQ